MGMISTAQFKKSIYIMFHDEPHMIVNMSFVSPGKGSAFYKTKLKSLSTGRIIDFTFKSGEKAEEVNVETKEAEYSYYDGSNYVFIEPRTFEQYFVPVEVVGEDKIYLKTGVAYRIKFYQDEVVGLTLPKSISCQVTETDDNAIKGDTATGATKPAVLDTGARVQVPLFIKKGETISIGTDGTGYLSRK